MFQKYFESDNGLVSIKGVVKIGQGGVAVPT